MKILVICQCYYPEPFRVHKVCEALASRGHQVTVLTGLPTYPDGVISEEYRGKSHRDEEVNGVRVIRVNEAPRTPGKIGLAKNYVSFVWNACWRALALKKDFDVIFVYQLSPVLMAIPAFVVRWFSKTKRIALYCLDLWPESLVSYNVKKTGVFFRFIKWVSQRIYNGVDEIGYSSGQFRQYFENELKLRPREYHYIPQFAESIFGDVEEKTHTGTNFVFAGNIGEMQSVQTIIKAAALLDDPDVRWHIVGDGSALERCKKLAEELNVCGKVIFYGRHPLSEMNDFYAMADAMVVTLAGNELISYTLPGKVQSYMAAGKAILAAANGETRTIIETAACGLCAPAEDAETLAEMTKSLRNMDTKEMGRNARAFYQEHFNQEKHIDRIEELLEA